MQPNEYQTLAERTAAPPGIAHEQLDRYTLRGIRTLHAVIGLCSDFHELQCANNPTNVEEELGDMFWYVAEACNAWQLKLENLANDAGEVVYNIHQDVMLSMSGNIASFASICEKHYFYGQPVSKDNIEEELFGIVYTLLQFASLYDLKLTDILASNISKLLVRYPDKFDTEKSMEDNRDRNAEEQVIKAPNYAKVWRARCTKCGFIAELTESEKAEHNFCPVCSHELNYQAVIKEENSGAEAKE